MSNRLEIKLTEAHEKAVSLKSMSSDALDSFMKVMSSLKSIADTVENKEDLNFSITEGSAVCAIEAPEPIIQSVFDDMDRAIKGESRDKVFTSHLRIIQEQIKNEEFKYNFSYYKGKKKIEIHPRLIKSNRIALKRKDRLEHNYKLLIIRGFLNQIGGKEPNYHFDYGHGEKITIACSMEDAFIVNKYLYKNITSLVVCKEWKNDKKRREYTHKIILEDLLVEELKSYIESYNKESDLVSKLSITHDFIDKMFSTTNFGKEAIKFLLIAYNDINFHLSELKTLLVISKPFKEDKIIKEYREALLATYEKKKWNA